MATLRVTVYRHPDCPLPPLSQLGSGVAGVTLWDRAVPPPPDGPAVWLAPTSLFGPSAAAQRQALKRLALPERVVLLLHAASARARVPSAADGKVHAVVPPGLPTAAVVSLLRSAITAARLADDLHRAVEQRRQLSRIGVDLSAESNLDRLLEGILQSARELTDADAGTLYLHDIDSLGQRWLVGKVSQNNTVNVAATEFRVGLDAPALSSHTGRSGESLILSDVYQLHPSAPYRFDGSYDRLIGYRTKSVLQVPIAYRRADQAESVMVGVLQILNRKPRFDFALESVQDIEDHVISFDEDCRQIVEALAGQAAVAIEKQRLLDSINDIFEGVLKAWVRAVEDLDPATAGHSQRVTALTLALAREYHLQHGPSDGAARFGRNRLRQLRYAGLLHDVGKIAVDPNILVKERRLYDQQMETLRERFADAKHAAALRSAMEALAALRRSTEETLATSSSAVGRVESLSWADLELESAELGSVDGRYRQRLRALDELLHLIERVNEVEELLPHDLVQELRRLGETEEYRTHGGEHRKLLHARELLPLIEGRGTLSAAEWEKMRAHPRRSRELLERIPWTPDLILVPRIAGAHHERLNGKGYPDRLTADQIPLEAKMMHIVDIYDACTASDRPYRDAHLPAQVLGGFLRRDRDAESLDRGLFELFVGRRVYRLAHLPLDHIEVVIGQLADEAPVPHAAALAREFLRCELMTIRRQAVGHAYAQSLYGLTRRLLSTDDQNQRAERRRAARQAAQPQRRKRWPAPVPPFWGACDDVLAVSFDELWEAIDEAALYGGQLRFRKRSKEQSIKEWESRRQAQAVPLVHGAWEQLTRGRRPALQPRAVYGYYPCASHGDELVLCPPGERVTWLRIPACRPGPQARCLADCFPADLGPKRGVLALVAATLGPRVDRKLKELYQADNFDGLLAAEAVATEALEALLDLVQARVVAELGRPDDRRTAARLPDAVFRGATRFGFGGQELPDLAPLPKAAELLRADRLRLQVDGDSRLAPAASAIAVVVHHPEAVDIGAPRIDRPNATGLRG